MKKSFVVVVLSLAGVAGAQTIEEVGDPDSFGRDVIHLGLGSIDAFYLQPDCTDEIAAGLQCQVPLAPPAVTEFSVVNGDSIQLPARASNSLLCFALTPVMNRTFRNDLANDAQAVLMTRALISIESSVLDNPALINPDTGLPFNGKLDIMLVTNHESRRITPGDFDTRNTTLTRSCQGALISKRALVGTYGLTPTQANSFFNNRITVRLSMNGTARMVQSMIHGFGLRLYGDRR
jgi:hypothetical protein